MNSDLTTKLETLKNDFYKENQKHLFFKNQQKNECATMISNTMDINILLKNTFLINDNDNKIIFIYTLFKTYANNSNILEIINFLFAIIKDKIYRFNNFEMHVNMDTYTITAHKRYENIYTTFFTMCCENNIPFSEKLYLLNVYNAPSMLSTLQPFFAPFIDKTASSKIFIYNKKDSIPLLNNLFHN